ncbi:GNAT family N-acetyltransferase [Streptomyces sp. NPDC101733]|uniref:GNAT family N-acetyltransferase n=1 Tax=unclassified Streptomyces TaxID=2593676 RepID=UPI0038123DD7
MYVTPRLDVAATANSPRLVLRSWRESDADALCEAHRDVTLRHYSTHPLDTTADALAWIGAREAERAAGAGFAFAVTGAEAGADGPRPLGNVLLKGVAVGKPTAEVGYWTAPHARGLGVAPRAVEAVTAWAFETLRPAGLERLELRHQSDNEPSCRVALKCGYALTGILAPHPPDFPLDGHLHVRRSDG